MSAPPGTKPGVCDGCGRNIFWITADGKTQIVDRMRANVYVYDEATGQHTKAGLGFLSHFRTCPMASRFSRGKR